MEIVDLNKFRSRKKEQSGKAPLFARAGLVLRMLSGNPKSTASSLSPCNLKELANLITCTEGSVFSLSARRMVQDVIKQSSFDFGSVVWLSVYIRFLSVLSYCPARELVMMFPADAEEFQLVADDVLVRVNPEIKKGDIFFMHDFAMEFPNSELADLVTQSAVAIREFRALPSAITESAIVPRAVRVFAKVYNKFADERADSLEEAANEFLTQDEINFIKGSSPSEGEICVFPLTARTKQNG